jgi:hypothetical protein
MFGGAARARVNLAGLLAAGAVTGLTALAYVKLARPRVLNWGAVPDEVEADLPGDGIVPSACLQTTRAIAIDAPPERVWPWLVQMGPRPRAGVYTYDWIERLLGIDIENADRIMPEFQHLEPGEFFALGDKGNGLRVRDVQPGQAIVLQWEPGDSTWAFVIRPDGSGGSRLVSRNRVTGAGPASWLAMAFMEPASLIMERKMLQGIKQRAEARR